MRSQRRLCHLSMSRSALVDDGGLLVHVINFSNSGTTRPHAVKEQIYRVVQNSKPLYTESSRNRITACEFDKILFRQIKASHKNDNVIKLY